MPEQNTQPTVTSKNLPPQPPLSAKPATAQAVIVPEEEIVAKPLATPDFLNLKKKNPNIELRWANRVAGTSTGQPGMRVDQLLAMGFAFATPSDVEAPASLMSNGKIIHGDLVLMKHDRVAYIGAIKYREERARQQASPTTNLREGQKRIREALKEAGAPAELAKKIQVFVPGEAETEALTK